MTLSASLDPLDDVYTGARFRANFQDLANLPRERASVHVHIICLPSSLKFNFALDPNNTSNPLGITQQTVLIVRVFNQSVSVYRSMSLPDFRVRGMLNLRLACMQPAANVL